MQMNSADTVMVDAVEAPDPRGQRAPTVFVGIDRSGPSSGALRWALHNAATPGAELALVHAVGSDWYALDPPSRSEAEPRGAAALEAAATTGREWWTGPIRSILAHGGAADTLALVASEQDLIVIGSNRAADPRASALGPTGRRIIAGARSSVAVIPDVPVNHDCLVVVGVSSSEASMLAVSRAASEAARCTYPLVIVHARRAFPYAWNAPKAEENIETARRIIARATEIARRVAPGVEITTRIVSQPVGVALLNASRGASLLVLGAGAHGSATRIEPVIHDIAENLRVPLLVARGRAIPSTPEARKRGLE